MDEPTAARRLKSEQLLAKIETALGVAQTALAELKPLVSGEDPVGRVLSLWVRAWRGRYQAEYDFTKTDRARLKAFVLAHGPQESWELLGRYLRDPDEWVRQRSHSLSAFFSRVNQYRAAPAAVNGTAPDLPAPPSDCHHVPRCVSDVVHTTKRRQERLALP